MWQNAVPMVIFAIFGAFFIGISAPGARWIEGIWAQQWTRRMGPERAQAKAHSTAIVYRWGMVALGVLWIAIAVVGAISALVA